LAAVDTRTSLEPERRSPRRGLGSKLERTVVPYLYISPFFILFAIFGVFTVAFTFWVSLHDWPMLAGLDRSQTEFVGVDNYVRLLTDDPRFMRAVQNTFSILLMTTIPQMIMALILAELLNDRLLRGTHIFRTGLLLPNITSVVAIAIIFNLIFARHAGIANAVLEWIGLDSINWRASRIHSHLAIASMVNWQWTGYNTLIFLAAMQSIPRDYHEAALVDGANRVQRWWRISLPLLRPAILFVTILSVIGGLQIFAQPLLFNEGASSSGGGADNQYLTVLLYLYDQAFSAPFRFGRASAIAWTLVVITVGCAGLVYGGIALLNRRETRAERLAARERKRKEAAA
jgi:cellobiose transport system permease protein